MEAGSDRVVLPTHRGRRGHPALVGYGLIQAIAQIPAGEGLRHLWHADPQLVREVPVEDPGVLLDLNTPEDYDAALRAASLRGRGGEGGSG